jgi:hypothetical protein
LNLHYRHHRRHLLGDYLIGLLTNLRYFLVQVFQNLQDEDRLNSLRRRLHQNLLGILGQFQMFPLHHHLLQ